MPQGRRKVPFSGKAKKEQLQQKRNRGQGGVQLLNKDPQVVPEDETKEEDQVIVEKKQSDKSSLLMDVTFSSGAAGRRKYDLIFQRESNVDIAERRELARKPYSQVDSKELEKDVDDFFPTSCDYPQRPDWEKSMSKAQIEASEAKYFREYVAKVMDKHEEQSLSYFELNLETWRQLWRVVEMSDILLLIVDARYPPAMMPPSLVKGVSPKPVVLVLNKVDLIPASLAVAWKAYFQERYSNIHVTFFTSCPAYNLRKPNYDEGMQFRRLRGRISMAKEGALQILETVKKIVGEKVDLKHWEEKIVNDEQSQDEAKEEQTEENVMLTLGMIGYPNVGKSSLINSLIGRRVVSVSRTPGHTKHFQTIFICPSVRLCDCPGLVFPSLVPRPFQVILGSYPISQTREPYSVIQFLAERIDLPKLLKLETKSKKWTTYDICEAWACKRGYVTARSNRPDIARAANHIMRMALEGRLPFAIRPQDFEQEHWKDHSDVEIIEDLLAKDKAHEIQDDIEEEEGSEESEKEESDNEEAPVTVAKNKFSALDIE